MATIEPRLIHLLNESNSPHQPRADLPPIYSLLDHDSSDRSRAPFEADASRRSERFALDEWASPNHGTYQVDSGEDAGLRLRRDVANDSEANLYPLSKILDDTPEHDDASSKKRHRVLTGKDDYPQLPQPVKKQKAAPRMPPIISGLHEPPPHAALFPPIASYDENETNQIKLLQDLNHSADEASNQHTSPEPDNASNKGRKRATKPRRKWSEAETNSLLLGVSRYGVGKWTKILEDQDFDFDDRSAGDLKDRFRTCCPTELQSASRKKQSGNVTPTSQASKSHEKKGTDWANVCIEDDQDQTTDSNAPSPESSHAGHKQKKTRAHRKNLEDLENLGIYAPFKKSRRRERRPFTEQDDSEILQGFELYGPAWTKIQRDPRFHLSERQPTDLRDRMRNKYPDVYQNLEKGSGPKAGAKGPIEPSVVIDSSASFTRGLNWEPHIHRVGSGEEMGRWSAYDIPVPGNPHLKDGEMDISRLLLDDRTI